MSLQHTLATKCMMKEFENVQFENKNKNKTSYELPKNAWWKKLKTLSCVENGKAKQNSFMHCQTPRMCDEKTWKHTSLVDTRTKSKALSNCKNSHWKNLKTHEFKQEWKAKLDALIVCKKPLNYKRWRTSTKYQATLELAIIVH